MRLGWDEIARRAKAFSEEWKDAHYEKGETQSFYNDFFEVFGIRRRTVADGVGRCGSLPAPAALRKDPGGLTAAVDGVHR